MPRKGQRSRYKHKRWICPNCEKEYAYNHKDGCKSCHYGLVPNDQNGPRGQDAPMGTKSDERGGRTDEKPVVEDTEGEDEPTDDDEEIANATSSFDVKLSDPSKGRKITEKEFIQIFHFIPDQINKGLSKVKDPEYRELADIWTFTDAEINELAGYVYALLDAYLPRFLIWLGGVGFYQIICICIAVFMMFGPRLIATFKWMKARKAKRFLVEAGMISEGGVPG